MVNKRKKNKIFNLPNKITFVRIFMSLIIIAVLVLPFDMLKIKFPVLYIKGNNERLVIDLKYIISGFLFIFASLTDFIDGKIARNRNLVTDFGKLIDAIADKILVNSILILLASSGHIHPIIPVVIVVRDSIVNSIKMIAASKGKVVAAIKSGKYKTATMMVGTTLVFFYNIPFEFINIRVDLFLLFVACILAIVSAIEYYHLNKNLIFEK